MKYLAILVLLALPLAAAETASTNGITVTKKNVASLLNGKKAEKMAALKWIMDEKYTKANTQLKAMLDSESYRSDADVFTQVVLANGRVQNTTATKRIIDLYKESSVKAVRFDCVLSLLEMKDISALKFVQEANETETDIHTREVLKKIVAELQKK